MKKTAFEQKKVADLVKKLPPKPKVVRASFETEEGRKAYYDQMRRKDEAITGFENMTRGE